MKVKYNRCLNCGNYFEVTNENKDSQYCSPKCDTTYIRCTVCGRYFEKLGPLQDRSFVCSEECAERYDFDNKTKKLKHLSGQE